VDVVTHFSLGAPSRYSLPNTEKSEVSLSVHKYKSQESLDECLRSKVKFLLSPV